MAINKIHKLKADQNENLKKNSKLAEIVKSFNLIRFFQDEIC